MIKKYTIRNINQNDTLHDKEFVVIDDVLELLTSVLNSAADAGADMDKLKELVNE